MEIRFLKPEEYTKAHELIKERAAWMEQPKGCALAGQFEGDELVGVVGVTQPWVIEPLVMKNGTNSEKLVTWIDGKLDPHEYFFFVKDERFQKIVENQYSQVQGLAGKLYVRRRYGKA